MLEIADLLLHGWLFLGMKSMAILGKLYAVSSFLRMDGHLPIIFGPNIYW